MNTFNAYQKLIIAKFGTTQERDFVSDACRILGANVLTENALPEGWDHLAYQDGKLWACQFSYRYDLISGPSGFLTKMKESLITHYEPEAFLSAVAESMNKRKSDEKGTR